MDHKIHAIYPEKLSHGKKLYGLDVLVTQSTVRSLKETKSTDPQQRAGFVVHNQTPNGRGAVPLCQLSDTSTSVKALKEIV